MSDELKVYLDHHIKRENLRYKRPAHQIITTNEGQPVLRLIDLIRSDAHNIFTRYLRKPDFQRATWSWTPEDCVSLLESVVGYHVIPSVILWKSPDNDLIYILDGGHRISVVLAWMKDDWGESQIREIEDSEQQKKIREAAARVRQLVKNTVGTFKEYEEAENEMRLLNEEDVSNPRTQLGEIKFAKAKFHSSLLQGNIAFNILWVKGDYQIAERSFLKINRSGRQLMDWEIKLIDNRNSSFARTVMSISSPDSAPHYWPLQPPEDANAEQYERHIHKIIENVRQVHNILFTPLHTRPIKTLAQPFLVASVEKKPYYIAELLTYFEGFRRGQFYPADRLLLQDAKASPKEIIENGYNITENAIDMFDHLTGKSPRSLGIIPLLYFYKSDGTYIRSLLYGFAFWLLQGSENEIRIRKEVFSAYREKFEFLMREDKDLIVSAFGRKVGSGTEVTIKTADYYQSLLTIIDRYKGNIESNDFLTDYMDMLHRLSVAIKSKTADAVRSRLFTTSQKSTAMADELVNRLMNCHVCGGKLNVETGVQHDHKVRVRDGGETSRENLRITHPFCNNRKDQIEAYKSNVGNTKLPQLVLTLDGQKPIQLRLFDDIGFE